MPLLNVFFTTLKLILGVVGGIIGGVAAVAFFVYCLWLLLNPSQAKNVLKRIILWAKQWVPNIKLPWRRKKTGNGISIWLLLSLPVIFGSLGFGLWFLFKNFNLSDDFDRPWWVWTIFVLVIVAVLLAIIARNKKWSLPSLRRSKLLSFDKSGRVLVTKRAKKPYWILAVLAGAFIVLMTMFVLSAPWKVLRWENHTANIEGSSEKKAGSGVVKINATNYFQVNEPKKFRVITNVTEQWETPIEENDVITLTFEGQGENWSYQVWKNKGTVYYKDIKIRKLPFSDGIHTVKTDKDCRILMTSTKPASFKRV